MALTCLSKTTWNRYRDTSFHSPSIYRNDCSGIILNKLHTSLHSYMTPRIETTAEKKLIGKHLKMSLANNRTGELWKNFIPRRNEITANRNTDLISMAV